MNEELRGLSVRAICRRFSPLLAGCDSEGLALTTSRQGNLVTKDSSRALERWPRSFQ